ncbi:unnamed protein product, partial [Ixodes pacificus]
PRGPNCSDGLCTKKPQIPEEDPDDVCTDLENPEDPEKPDINLEITDETLEDLEPLSDQENDARISKWQPQPGATFSPSP